MLKYILKRILIFIPTLLVISIVVFTLSVYAPGDPVEAMMAATGGGNETRSEKVAGEEAYNRMREKLNLHLPPFYFTLTTAAYPKNLYSVPKIGHQVLLSGMVDKHGNWEEIKSYYDNLKSFEVDKFAVEKDSSNAVGLIKISEQISKLFIYPDDATISNVMRIIDKTLETTPSLQPVLGNSFDEVKASYGSVLSSKTTWKNYVPSFNWYGLNNRYHKWMAGFVKMDFGMSYQDRQPIGRKIWDNIFWTMLISIISIILTYLIAVPLGVFSANRKGTTADSVVTTILFIFYSLPSFWIATLLIIYLCSPDALEWFPPFGLGDVEGLGFFESLGVRAYHLVLPLICWTYSGLAFLSRQMRGGMLAVMKQDFIRTARAKGLDERTITWRHVFRNSLLPIITLFANVFPLMISGSVVIEVIFTLPGMGKMLIDAMTFKDYPVVFTIVMMVAFLTMVGYLIADILYAMVDPRIKFK